MKEENEMGREECEVPGAHHPSNVCWPTNDISSSNVLMIVSENKTENDKKRKRERQKDRKTDRKGQSK
jgi:hypothetical protein